ncbi:MAG: methionyl-tRNA formyltransferase [Acidimicrobiia bacterium]
MRVAFFGTPIEAVPFLDVLNASGNSVVCVVTQPPRRRARRSSDDVSPVHERASELGVPVVTPADRASLIASVAPLEIDLALVVAYGRIIPPDLLARARYVNVHFSKLPRWRGAAPVERALLSGDELTAVALMEMEEGLDTGGILAECEVEIMSNMTTGSLKAQLVQEGCRLLEQHLSELSTLRARAQVGESTYAAKLEIEEFRVTRDRTMTEIDRMVRAGTPRPGAFFEVGGQRIKLWSVERSASRDCQTGFIEMVDHQVMLGASDGALEIRELQAGGKARMDAASWWRGLNTSRIELSQ